MKLTVLGSTGSIGTSTLEVVDHVNQSGAGEIELTALVAGSNLDLFIKQCMTFRPKHAVIANEALLPELKSALAGSGIDCHGGDDAVITAAREPVDKVMAAISGTCGMEPTFAAVEAGNDILLANKEAMVCAGPILKEKAKATGANIIPVDSEHSAIFQCLDGSDKIESMTLTASGGPFLNTTISELELAQPKEALAHPNWAMGTKNTLDSATLMNKGLELIEAVYLFDIDQSRIDVLIHPQSIIHSMVSYVDGSVIAQLGSPDMKTPIAYALSYPDRLPTTVKRLDLRELARLDFAEPDHVRFPALNLARQSADAGLLGTCTYNIANELAGRAFLEGRCGFLDIAKLVRISLHEALDRDSSEMPHTVSGIEDVRHVTAVTANRFEDYLGSMQTLETH